MPKDIRSFFKKSSSDTANEADDFVAKPINRKRSKKKGVLFDDSSDEEVFGKHIKKKKVSKNSNINDANIIPNSDEETKPVKLKKNSKQHEEKTKILSATTPTNFFGKFNKTPKTKSFATKRKASNENCISVLKTPKKENVESVIIDDLDDLLNESPKPLKRSRGKESISSKLAKAAGKVDKSLSQKVGLSHEKEKRLERQPTVESKSELISPSREVLQDLVKPSLIKPKKESNSTLKKDKNGIATDSSKMETNNNIKTETNQLKDHKADLTKKSGKTTPEKKKVTKQEEQQGSAKKERFMKYQQWQNRSGPSAPGSKEIPKGADYCLEGFTFVITGIQESMTREEIQSLVERYGGKVTTSVSGKTSYLLTGEDAGQSKLAKAEKCKTKIIDEDEFLNLIKTLPGKRSKYEIKLETESKVTSTSSTVAKPSSVKKEVGLPNTEELSKNNSKATKLSSGKVCPDFKPQQPAPKTNVAASLMWVDKYKPANVKQIIGQQGASSNVQKLLKWLRNWHANNRSANGKAKPKPKINQWGGGDPTGASFKAALLSGPPGVGKTTSATLVCKELGLSFVELNASDTRSKRTLKEEVAASVQNTSIVTMFGQPKSATTNGEDSNHVLIMDEVDGMAGNEDRGGMQELILIIKSTRIPIICMCNDRSSPKMRSLTNHCFDLRFQRPRVEQITGAVMSICYKEGMKVQAPAVQAIIRGCNQDIRQVLHNLNMIRANDTNLSYDNAKAHANKSQKDVNLGIFDIARKLLSTESASLSITEKSNLFFMDYSIIPKFVQENYLHVTPFASKGNTKTHLKLLSQAADSMALGDLVETSLRHDQAWSLLPMLGLVSTVLPCDYMRGGMHGMINFPSFFGKLSTTGKNRRLLQELKFHSSLETCGSTEQAFNLDLLPYLRWRLLQPLVDQSNTGENHIQHVTALLSGYDFVREDFDSLVEVGQFPGRVNHLQKIDSKVKSAFTRTFNKESHLIPYAVLSASAAKKKGKNASEDLEMNGDAADDVQDSDEDDTIDNDGMIKQAKKKAPAAKSKSTKKKSDSGTSKKGKGKKK